MRSACSLLFMGRRDDENTLRALEFCKDHFAKVEWVFGERGDAGLAKEMYSWKGDFLVSYLFPCVVPKRLLERAAGAAINFHPGPPECPGTGCYSAALYNDAHEYGTTCHHMVEEVDAGDIIAVKRFKVFNHDTVPTLRARAHVHQLSMFYDVMSIIVEGGVLPKAGERWGGIRYSRKRLDDLSRITPQMDQAEIARRVRATTAGPWKTSVQIQGFTFELKT